MLQHWIKDYIHLVKGHARAFKFKEPPRHYLGHIVKGKVPIILIPGVHATWHFLKPITDKFSLKGHPIYIVPSLGYNVFEIPKSARIVKNLIDERKLKNVVIIAHSKGGLIAKQLLAFSDQNKKVNKVIAIATPFAGTWAVKYMLAKHYKELHPQGRTIKKLLKQTKVNSKIVSIYGIWDNHVWPTESCHLKGAKNIEVNVLGHHKILDSRQVIKVIEKELR